MKKVLLVLGAMGLLVIAIDFAFVKKVAADFGRGSENLTVNAQITDTIPIPDVPTGANTSSGNVVSQRDWEKTKTDNSGYHLHHGNDIGYEINTHYDQTTDIVLTDREGKPMKYPEYSTIDSMSDFSNGEDGNYLSVEEEIPFRKVDSRYKKYRGLSKDEYKFVTDLEAAYTFIIRNLDLTDFAVREGVSIPDYRYYSKTIDSIEVGIQGWDGNLFRFAVAEYQRNQKIRIYLIYQGGNLSSTGIHYQNKFFWFSGNSTSPYNDPITKSEMDEIISYIQTESFWK